MAGLGTVYVELDLDASKFERNQREVLKNAVSTATSVEKNWQILGAKSDNIFKAMAQGQINAFEMIAKKGAQSADEVFRAQSAMVAKINALNQDMTKNPLYESLGIKSVQAIEAQKAAIMSSYNTIKNSGQATAQDLINIERAKNQKLKELNKEMVGQHDMSMAAMMRAVLRLYAAYYVVSNAAKTIVSPFIEGFRGVEEYNTSVASMAAMVMTFAEAQKGVSQADQWKEALRYASSLVPVLETIAARTLLSGEETTALANAFARSGVFLDATNAKQLEGFTRLSNALPLMTKGQEIMRQINTEITAMMSGSSQPSAMLLKNLRAIDPQIKENLKTWQAEGSVLEHLGELLKGFGPATEILELQWQAVKTTIDTTVTQTLRAGMKGAYAEIIDIIKDVNKALEIQKEEIAVGMTVAWSLVKNTLMTIWGILQGFGPVLRDIGAVVGTIAYGWGGVMAALKPIGELIGNTIAMVYELGKVLAHVGMAGWQAATGNITLAKAEIAAAKQSMKDVNTLIDKNIDLTKNGIIDSIALYANQVDAARKAANLPPIKPPKARGGIEEGDDKQFLKDEKRRLQALTQVNEDYYRESIKRAETWLTMLGKTYANELNFALDAIGKKEDALNNWYTSQTDAINRHVKNEVEKTAKLDALDSEYQKRWSDLQNKRGITEIEVIEFQKKAQSSFVVWSQKNMEEQIAFERRKGADLISISADTWDKIYLYQLLTGENLSAAQKQNIDDYLGEWWGQSESMAKYYSTIQGYEDEYRKHQLDYIEKVRQYEIAAIGDVEAANKKAALAKKDLFKNELNMVGQKYDEEHYYQAQSIKNAIAVFDNASSLMDQESKEYETMQNIKKALQIAELAMTIQKNLAILAQMPAIIAAQNAQAVSAGATAINSQGSGDPYTAFARMAAMLAIVTSVLGMAGIAFGGGSSAIASAPRATTTVLGSEEQSQSASKAWELLKDTYDMEYRELSGIYNQMKNLNQNITGLVTSIVRNYGSFEGISKTSDYNQLNPVLSRISEKYSLFADKIFAAIDQVLFGSTTVSSTASGLSVSGSGVVRPYTDVLKERSWSIFGGSGRDERYTEFGDIDRELSNLFGGPNGIYTNIKESFVTFAQEFGTDVKAATDYVFADAKINLQGKSSEEISAAMTEYISTIGDTAVDVLFGDIIRQYQLLDEGLMETAVRITINKNMVLSSLDKTGQALAGTTVQLIAFTDAIVKLAGGLEEYTSMIEQYYSNFFTEEEQMADTFTYLTRTLNGMWLPLSETRQGFRAIMSALDLTTDSGRNAYITMLKLSENADKYYSYLEEEETRRQNRVKDLTSEYYNALIDHMRNLVQEQKTLVDSLSSMSDAIGKWIDNLKISDLAPVQSAEEWTRQYEEAKQKASASGATTEDVSNFLSSATRLLEFQKSYGTDGSYKAIYDSVMGDVEGMGTGIDAQLEVAKSQLTVLEAIETHLTEALGLNDHRFDDVKVWADEFLVKMKNWLDPFSDVMAEAVANHMKTKFDTQIEATLPSIIAAENSPTGSTPLDSASAQSVLNLSWGKIDKLLTDLVAVRPDLTGETEAVRYQAAYELLDLKKLDSGFITGDFIKDLEADVMWNQAEYQKLFAAIAVQQAAQVAQVTEWWQQQGFGSEAEWLAEVMRQVGDYGASGGLATGGLTSGITMAGERGPEWVIPTYEPERSAFLRSAPLDFWENLTPRRNRTGPTYEEKNIYLTVEIPVVIDGREIGQVVAKQVKVNGDLQDSIKNVRRAN